jgi:hypothetical protein
MYSDLTNRLSTKSFLEWKMSSDKLSLYQKVYKTICGQNIFKQTAYGHTALGQTAFEQNCLITNYFRSSCLRTNSLLSIIVAQTNLNYVVGRNFSPLCTYVYKTTHMFIPYLWTYVHRYNTREDLRQGRWCVLGSSWYRISWLVPWYVPM